MLSTVKNYDIICLQLRNYYPQLENPLQKDTDALLNSIRSIVTSKKQVKPAINKILPAIFNLRVKAIKWLFEDSKPETDEFIDDIIPHFEELKEIPRYEILAENILFALRCNKRVIGALLKSGDFSKENFSSHVPNIPIITYNQFITSLALGIPDDKIVQKIVDWTTSSLYIEFVSLSALIIKEECLNVSDKILNDLAFLIADAAQSYFAGATELGIIQPHFSKQTINHNVFDTCFINEQKLLAEFGMEDYFENL